MNSEELQKQSLEVYPIVIIEDYDINEEMRDIWLAGATWQSSQLNGCYTEDDLRWAIISAFNRRGAAWEIEEYTDEYIKSI